MVKGQDDRMYIIASHEYFIFEIIMHCKDHHLFDVGLVASSLPASPDTSAQISPIGEDLKAMSGCSHLRYASDETSNGRKNRMSTATCSAYILPVLVLVMLLRNFWRLRRARQFSEKYDVDINQGRYETLPIYAYIRYHVHIALFACTTLLIIGVILAIFSIECHFQVSPFLGIVSTMLTVLLGVHMAFIACYESTNPGKRIVDPDIRSRVRDFRRWLWINALLLFVSIVLTIMSRTVLLIFSSYTYE